MKSPKWTERQSKDASDCHDAQLDSKLKEELDALLDQVLADKLLQHLSRNVESKNEKKNKEAHVVDSPCCLVTRRHTSTPHSRKSKDKIAR